VAVGDWFEFVYNDLPGNVITTGRPGKAGYVLYWPCRTGCLFVGMRSMGGDGIVHVKTRTNEFDMVFVAGVYNYLLVNHGTGDYSTDFNVPIDGCGWPE